MTSIWSSSSSPAAPFPKVFSDQNWCVLGNGNSRRGSHHAAVNTSPHIWTSVEHERPRGWYLKIQVWTKISIKHKPLKLSVYMWICMISCFNFTFVIGPIKYQPNFSSLLTQSTDPLLGPTCQVHYVYLLLTLTRWLQKTRFTRSELARHQGGSCSSGLLPA